MNEPTSPPPASPTADPSPGADDALYAALRKADRSESLLPFAAGLAQELNDLLARILGGVTLARARGDVSGLAQAEAACIAARDATRRILALSEGGDGTLTGVSPQKLLAEAAAVAGAGTVAEIAIDAPDSVDSVWADPAAMAQAVRNLVRNSIEAMSPPPQRPRIQLRASNATLPDGRIAGLPAGDYVELEVRDNGKGIQPGNLDKIWEPFFTTKEHGTGLGLPTTLAIVRRHGGQIGVDSTVGVGTVFTIFLPRARSTDVVRASRAPAERFRSGRVLVMDDDPEMRTLVGSMLETLDYRFDTARDCAEAYDYYRKYLEIGRPYDAVILDLTIPGGPGGEETFARLRLLDPDVRAIASSGRNLDSLSQHCLDAGFCGWLGKPYRVADLAEALKVILG